MDHQPEQLDRNPAFSLVELLLTIAIVSIVLAFSTGVSIQSISAYRLTSVAGKLESDLTYAMQLASKLNHPVEMRFYRYTGTDDLESRQFASYQFLIRRSRETRYEQLSRVYQMETGVTIHSSTTFSTILNQEILEPGENDPEIALSGDKSKEFNYVSFQIRPDGTTSLRKDIIWTLTIVAEQDAESEQLPRNYRTLVINPVNGAVAMY